MMPTDAARQGFAEIVRNLQSVANDRVDTAEALTKLGDYVDKFNDDCCGCGWAMFVADALRGTP